MAFPKRIIVNQNEANQVAIFMGISNENNVLIAQMEISGPNKKNDTIRAKIICTAMPFIILFLKVYRQSLSETY